MRNATRIPDGKRGLVAVLAIALAAGASGCATKPPGRLTQLSWPGYDTTIGSNKTTWRQRAPERKAVRVVSNDVATPTAKPRRTQAAQQKPLPPVTGTRFIWPVNGPVIAGFGVGASGARNDGINISVPAGEPVRAAATGTVTYAGELRGYGKIVLVEHEDGYVTAYAHAQSVNVNRGDRVLKGQVIAHAGETGDVLRPQLHFEIRRGVKPVNPEPLMVASARSS